MTQLTQTPALRPVEAITDNGLVIEVAPLVCDIAPQSGKRRVASSPDSSKQAVRQPTAQRLQNVLIIEATAERLAWLADVVSSEYHVVAARSADEALRILDCESLDLVVADAATCCAGLLAGLSAHQLARSTIFLADSAEVVRLVDAYASRHVFSVLHDQPSADELLAFIRSILSPRIAARYELGGVEVQLQLRPRSRIKCRLLDLSNRGLALFIPADQGLLLPDTSISSLRLVRGSKVLFDGVSAVVRHVELLQNQDTAADVPLAYKVGLEFRNNRVLVGNETEKIVDQPIRMLAVIQEGLRDRALTVRSADSSRIVTTGPLQSIDRSAGILRIGGTQPPGLTIGDVVRANFEHTGTSYSFFSSIVEVRIPDVPCYGLKLPRALRAIRQRRSPRIQPPQNQSITVNVVSPFDGSIVERPVLNITASGLAFPISESTELFPVGTQLPKLVLRFPNQPAVTYSGVVRTLVSAHDADQSGQAVCGVEFDRLSAMDRAKLAGSIIQCGEPSLKDGSGTRFADLWDFLTRARFLYPEKLGSIDVPAVERTLTRLLSEPNDVLKTSLIGKDSEMIGHASAVRAYSRTWILQHLATVAAGKSTFTSGRLLNLAVIRYLEQIPGIEWVKIWYRPTNKWPARVFGTFARRVADPSLSHLATLEYLVSNTVTAGRDEYGVSVRSATHQDLRHIEAYFVSHQAPLLLRSDDLSSRDLMLTSVSTIYQTMDLKRSREVIVAEHKGKFAGFALLEISSLGLNLSELTNTFRVFTLDPDTTVQRALMCASRNRYGEIGREHCIALALPEQTSVFESVGFELRKKYTCWTWHRSLYQRFCDHILRLHLEN